MSKECPEGAAPSCEEEKRGDSKRWRDAQVAAYYLRAAELFSERGAAAAQSVITQV